MSNKNPVMISQSPLIQFGAGLLRQVGRQAKFLKGRKALVVTDPGVQALGIIDRVLERLKKESLEAEVFTRVQANPTDEDILAGAEVYKQTGCDLIVSVGGGSPIDAGKGIRLMARCGGAVPEYDVLVGGVRKIPWDLPPMIALPTTAGTGSEVTNVAVITLSKQKVKISLIGAALMPSLALVDPELTVGLPPGLTAATGMDALTHCIEAFSVRSYCPPADQAALGGMELVGTSLVKAVENGKDLDARTDMAMAAVFGGLSFPPKGVGASHGLAHPLSAVCGVHHGLANAIMLPWVMDLNCAAVPEKFARIAAALRPGAGRPEEAAQIVREMNRKIGLPQKLSEVGVTRAAFDVLAENAAKDVSMVANPVLLSVEELKAVYERAF